MAERRVDAAWISPEILNKNEPREHCSRIAGKLFGGEPGRNLVNIAPAVEGGMFVRRSPTDPAFLWPSNHPRAGTPRYEWEDVEDRKSMVRVGYLLPEEAEAD